MRELRFAELRAEGRTLSGIAVPYNSRGVLPWGEEIVRAGAFGDVERADVVLNRQHDRGQPLARTGGGGMVLTDTASALTMRAELPKTQDADDVLTLVSAGVMRGMSIEFVAKRDSWEGDLRTIEEATLVGLAIVDKPAYGEALVQARMAALDLPRGLPVRRVGWW